MEQSRGRKSVHATRWLEVPCQVLTGQLEVAVQAHAMIAQIAVRVGNGARKRIREVQAAHDEIAKEVSHEIAREAGREIAKEAGQEIAKEASREIAKKAGHGDENERGNVHTTGTVKDVLGVSNENTRAGVGAEPGTKTETHQDTRTKKIEVDRDIATNTEVAKDTVSFNRLIDNNNDNPSPNHCSLSHIVKLCPFFAVLWIV